MRPTRKRSRQTALPSSVFLQAVPQDMLASLSDGMVLSPLTRPRRVKTGWSVRLVWRNRAEGTSVVMTLRVSDDLHLTISSTAWTFGALIAGSGGAGEAACG